MPKVVPPAETKEEQEDGLFKSLLESSIVKELHEAEVNVHEYFEHAEESDPMRFTMVVEPWNDAQNASSNVKTAEDKSSNQASKLR